MGHDDLMAYLITNKIEIPDFFYNHEKLDY